MKGTMTAGEVHKQYNEIVTAFRKLIPDPALRLTFSRQVDGYMRQYALGVWQADSASGIQPEHVEYILPGIRCPPPCTGRWPQGWPALTCFSPPPFSRTCSGTTG